MLRNWEVGIEEDENAFNIAQVWLQVWNLPIHCMPEIVGKKIGTIFNEVKEVLIPQTGGKEGRHEDFSSDRHYTTLTERYHSSDEWSAEMDIIQI